RLLAVINRLMEDNSGYTRRVVGCVLRRDFRILGSFRRGLRAEASPVIYACEGGRDGRVVDGGGLENHCTRKGTGGSNPSPSATSIIVARRTLARRQPGAIRVAGFG